MYFSLKFLRVQNIRKSSRNIFQVGTKSYDLSKQFLVHQLRFNTGELISPKENASLAEGGPWFR